MKKEYVRKDFKADCCIRVECLVGNDNFEKIRDVIKDITDTSFYGNKDFMFHYLNSQVDEFYMEHKKISNLYDDDKERPYITFCQNVEGCFTVFFKLCIEFVEHIDEVIEFVNAFLDHIDKDLNHKLEERDIPYMVSHNLPVNDFSGFEIRQMNTILSQEKNELYKTKRLLLIAILANFLFCYFYSLYQNKSRWNDYEIDKTNLRLEYYKEIDNKVDKEIEKMQNILETIEKRRNENEMNK